MRITEKTSRAIFLTLFISIGGFFMSDAYAVVPQFSTYVADDPDNGDTVFSNGDTLTITFSVPTNATGSGTITRDEINANFTDGAGAPDLGTAYSGVWSADSQTLTITVTDVTGSALTIGVSTIGGAGTTNISSQADDDNANLINVGGDTATLSGDFGVIVSVSADNNSGGDCSTDCTEPTLGLDSSGRRLVQDGFTYNGKPVDVELYYTPYPLITVNVGERNLAEFKIFDERGPANISHLDLAFGLAKGQILSQSKAMIEWDRLYDGTELVNVVDPDNLLSDDVKVFASNGKCREDSVSDDCLVVRIYHTFRAPPEFNIVGTNVWDYYRNAWQNYYNHGIEVVGKSMNPPKQYLVLDDGKPITITEVEKNHAVDEYGNNWFFEKNWTKEYVPAGKIVDPISKYHGVERDHAYFETYLRGQELVALHTLDVMLDGKTIQGEPPKDPVLSEELWVPRGEDMSLQKTIRSETERAEQIYRTLYPERPDRQPSQTQCLMHFTSAVCSN